MPYLIQTFDAPERAHLRQEHYEAHLAYLETVAPLLLGCGAKLDDDGERASGGIYVVAVDTRDEATELIENDPFYEAGLFDRVDITRWRKAYLDGVNYLGGN